MKLCAGGAIFIYEIKVVCLRKRNKLFRKKMLQMNTAKYE